MISPGGWFLQKGFLVRGFESQTEVCATSRLHFDGGFSLQFAPTHHGAAYRSGDGLHHYVIHYLAIAEALEEEPPKQTPAFFALQHESKTGRAPIDGQKQGVVKKYLSQIGKRVADRLLQAIKQTRQQRIDEDQIHHRRDQRKQYLEYPHVRQGDKSQRAVTRTEEHVTVFPDTL